MSMKIIGFDLDGVLCDISLTCLTMLHEHNDKDAMYYYLERKPLLDPNMLMHENDKSVCITARSSEYHDVTRRWMKKYHPDMPVYFFEKDVRWFEKGQIAECKVECIRNLGIDIYIDDDPEIIDRMRNLVNDITFIQYGGRLLNEQR